MFNRDNESYKANHSKIQILATAQFKSRTYKLSSIVSHHGPSPKSGDYVAHISRNSEWFEVNDNLSTKMDQKIVFEQCSTSCYILVFTRE